MSAGVPAAVSGPAPAKLNLFLHLTGRRADGYHLLDSLVVFAGIGDRLDIQAADELSLSLDGRFAADLAAEPVGANLALKAAEVLRAEAGCGRGAHIRLTKNLPAGAGLGGGSADAAAALRLLPQMWGIAVAPRRLAALALTLGADVPVCLAGQAARMGGIGEAVTPVKPSGLTVPAVIAHTGKPLATADVFRSLTDTERHRAPAADFNGAADLRALRAYLETTRNDLEPAALRLQPDIGHLTDRLRAAEGCVFARMTGSGAACFGLFGDDAAAEAAAARIASAGLWAVATVLAL